MKRIALVIVLLFMCSLKTYSQTYALDAGSIMLSGTVNFASASGDLYENIDKDSKNILGVYPDLNFFVAPNFFVGGGLSFLSNWQGDNSETAIGLGPNVGYAFGNSKSTVFPFISAGFRYYSTVVDTKGGDATSAMTEIILKGGIWMIYYGHLGIIIDLGYSIVNNDPDKGKSLSGNAISLNVGIAGFFYGK